ncbi:hypothetical protein KQR56_09965 [Bacillus velezensis]|nr:hypothetical protein [Bacillus velezensis]
MLRRTFRIETSVDVEAANTTKLIRPATEEEIIEYKKKLGKKHEKTIQINHSISGITYGSGGRCTVSLRRMVAVGKL